MSWTLTRPPSGEYLTALSTRFVRTWRTLSGSAAIGGASFGAERSSLMLGGMYCLAASTTPRASSTPSQRSIVVCRPSDSSRLTHKTSLTIRARRSDSLAITSSSPVRCGSGSRTSSRRSVSAAP